MLNLFGMITTAASRDYTPLALRSLFARTPIGPADQVVLIDNDGDFSVPADIPAERLTVVRRETPHGFAANANLLLARARAAGADLFLLNNDLVFTTGWLEPLLLDRRSLLSPLSNAQISATSGRLTTQPLMQLTDYRGRDADLEAIASRHRATNTGVRTTIALTFFCVRIPRAVYEVVGDFDERFGKGGGEDRDYAVRAWIAGIPQEYALGSYVLHFQGMSTWRGPETTAEQVERDALYIDAFGRKWGAALTHAFIGGNWNLFRSDPKLAGMLDRQEFSALVRYLRSHPSIDAFLAERMASDARCAAGTL